MSKKCVQIYKLPFQSKSADPRGKPEKNIVFDFDETIGSFTDLEILWSGMKEFATVSSETQQDFNELLKLYPEFLRVGIFPIFEFLRSKKISGECSHIYVYTNNQFPPYWTNFILRFIEEQLSYNTLFDDVVGAYKIGKQIMNKERTTQEKTYADLLNATDIGQHDEICFVDNTFYEKMRNKHVYYIQPDPYYHNLSMNEIIDRFLGKYDIGSRDFWKQWFGKKNKINIYTPRNNNNHLVVTKKMMYYIKDFFYITGRKPKTRKPRIFLGKFTRKKNTR